MNYDFEDSYNKLVEISQGDDKVFMQSDGTKIKSQKLPPEPTVPGVTRSVGRPKPDPTKAGTVGAQVGLERLGSMLTSAAPGAVIGTLGAPGDILGFFKGLYDAATAEEGEGIDAFLTGMTEVSESIGSELGLKYIRDNIDMLPIRDDLKKAIIDGADIGSLFGLGGALTAGGKAIYQGGKRMMSGPATVTKVDAAADSLEPIIIENPEAGPLDRSQLPQKIDRPEAKPSEIDELGFVLKSLEVAKNLQQKRGTAQQFLKRLEQNGVSAEEIDALGLREKFSDPNERITRDQFVQTIRDRRIELQEKVKGSDVDEIDEIDQSFLTDLTFGEGTPDRDSMNWQDRAENYMMDAKEGEEYAVNVIMNQIESTYPDSYPPEEIARIRQALINKEFDELDRIDQSNIDDAAYDVAEAEYMENPYMEYRANETDNYTIFGNDDIGYQVLRYGNERVNNQEVYSLSEAQVIARQDAYEQGDLIADEMSSEARFEGIVMPGGQNYQEVLIKDPSTPATYYPGDHWSEGNVIGHLLTKDRTDSTGKKALYVEEVQSDFAQSARAKFSREKARIDRDMKRVNERIATYQKDIDAYKKRIENPIEGDNVEALKEALGPKQRGLESEIRGKQILEMNLQDASDKFDVETEELSKVRFVKDTQQWLRPTLKRLIAKAIEGGYDSVAVPPFQIVHGRYGEDYGDFYRKSVPNTLLKAAKQLDPNAKISRADFSDSLREGNGVDERALEEARKAGIDSVQIIEITPAMRKAYEEKGQSLFVPAVGAAIAGKMAADQMTKEQEDDRAKATR